MELRDSVVLSNEKCNGCDKCMKRCPTEAIRIENSKAVIMYERCVGCGECVRVCPSHAKTEIYDPLEMIHNYKYKVALPSPSMFGQFNNLTDINYVLTGLKKMGFDDVFEASIGAEILSDAYGKLLKSKNFKKPIISTACPAVKNLILMRYDYPKEHLSPMLQPEIVAAQLAVEKAMRETGYERKDIGIFLISQCAANVIEIHRNYPSLVDGVLAFKEVYFPLLAEITKLQPEEVEKISKANWSGIICGSNTGEAINLGTDNFLTASGVENVRSVLNELEREKLNNLDFIELYACNTGCTGGSLNIENCYIARTRLRLLRKYIPRHKKIYKFKNFDRFMHEEYTPINVLSLSEDRAEAMQRMIEVNEILSKLPKLDCGACGAPSCRAFAEDTTKGYNRKCRYLKEVLTGDKKLSGEEKKTE